VDLWKPHSCQMGPKLSLGQTSGTVYIPLITAWFLVTTGAKPWTPLCHKIISCVIYWQVPVARLLQGGLEHSRLLSERPDPPRQPVQCLAGSTSADVTKCMLKLAIYDKMYFLAFPRSEPSIVIIQ
jgi:hypothetical protein